MEFVAGVTFDQAAALSDGAVNVDEMQQALDAAVACIEDLGYAVTLRQTDPQRGLTGGYSLEVSEGDLAARALATCREATVSELDLPFLSASSTAVPLDEREQQVRLCLAAQGHDVEGMSLAEMFGAVGPEQVRLCDPVSDG